MEFGKVESLWRYPVKSLIGESLNSFDINEGAFQATGSMLYRTQTVSLAAARIPEDLGASMGFFLCRQ